MSVIAENRHAASEPATIRLRWKGTASKDEFEIKPKLYVLAVGVSTYQDADLRLDLAAKDALDFGAAWNDQRGRLYSGVEVRTLTDAQATKGNILDGLEWVQRQMTAHDVAVMFFAGHGINDPTGVFYFLPVDADLEKLKRTGISQSDITSTVANIAGKVLVFMDACHSGNLTGKLKRRRGGGCHLGDQRTGQRGERGRGFFLGHGQTVRSGERGVGKWGLHQGAGGRHPREG